MINGKLLVEKLLAYAEAFLHLDPLDVTYVRNTLLAELKLPSPYERKENLSFVKEMSVPDVLINELKDYAMENGISPDETDAELFAAYIMGLLTPKPSEINSTFNNLCEKIGAQAACNYLYKTCVMNNYIQKSAIAKNIGWTHKDGDNVLEITINLSKPEKNNKDIAKLVNAKSTGKYPECALCKENEGFYGNQNHPPRANLRTTAVTLNGEKWYMQYSPYAYYNEHCIVFNEKHVPMQMTGETILKLLDFVEIFPNYFIGSNSDLPIVGGSILNHEHYQGGRHEMPMHKAKVLFGLSCEKYPDVEAGILDWYNSAIRLTGYNKNTICALGADIINAWKAYSDESVGIINSKNERHNTVTPIARKLSDEKYCLDLILRNNVTTDEYPDGVFHAHPEHHNIKKEGIGLIEAMGLFILPGRLKKQTEQIADILIGNEKYSGKKMKEDDPLYVHKDMIEKLLKENPDLQSTKDAEKVIRDYVNETCVDILRNTAVFKNDEAGVIAFKRFLNTLGIR